MPLKTNPEFSVSSSMMKSTEDINSRLFGVLACPRDHSEICVDSGSGHLRCAKGHTYPIVEGIPVFLLPEQEQTIGVAEASLKAAETGMGNPLYVNTLGLSDEQRRAVERDWRAGDPVDAAISYLIGATSGLAYLNLVGRLQNYPIPDIPIATSTGDLLLDLGSNWGRWSMAAARKGWSVVAVDPSLGALLAARRACSRMGLNIAFVCGDARFLPFKRSTFDCVFSYSVVQHFSRSDAELVVAELGRTLRHDGFAKIQMAHKYGLRSILSRTRPDYSDRGQFSVRYWSMATMRRVYEQHIGPTNILAEAFGGLGLLSEDRAHVGKWVKVLITISALLKKASRLLWPLVYLADSVYVVSKKQTNT